MRFRTRRPSQPRNTGRRLDQADHAPDAILRSAKSKTEETISSMPSGKDGYSRKQTALRFVVVGHASGYVTGRHCRARRRISIGKASRTNRRTHVVKYGGRVD